MLATTGVARSPALPELPTIAESGLKGYENSSWSAVAAPAGTPKPILDRLSREFTEILKLPDIREKLASVGNIPTPSTPEQMQEYIERDAARWSRVVDIKGIEKY